MDPAIADDPLFNAHGCCISGKEGNVLSDWKRQFSIRTSNCLSGACYIDPPATWNNHFLWGGSFASNEPYSGKHSSANFVDKFFSNSTHIALTTLGLDDDFTLEATSFSFGLGLAFREWAGFSQEFIVIDLENLRTVFLDDDLEYTLLCRHDHSSIDFEGKDFDSEIKEGFRDLLIDFGIKSISPWLRCHLDKEVIKNCGENSFWQEISELE